MNIQKTTTAPFTTVVTNLNKIEHASELSLRQNAPARSPDIADFITARDKLVRRRDELKVEWDQIISLLKDFQSGDPVPPLPAPPIVGTQVNRGSLTKAVEAILQNGPLSKKAVIEQLEQRGFPFSGNPKAQVNSVIYLRRFRREAKLFSLAENPTQVGVE